MTTPPREESRPAGAAAARDAASADGAAPRGSARDAAPVRIRPAVPGDGPRLASLMATVYEEGRWFVGDGPPTGDALARRLRGVDPARDLYLVAETDAGRRGRLSGWVELHRFAPWRIEHVASLTIAVAEGERGRGVGRRLMRAVLPWARRVGVRKIRLDVRAGNAAAIALYRSEGYVVEGVERGAVRLDDGEAGPGGAAFEDNLTMALDLAGGPDAT